VIDVDGEDRLLVATESGAPRQHFGGDDVGVLVVNRPKCREVDIGVRVAGSNVEPWRVVVALGRDGAVASGVPLEDAPVV